MWSLQLTISEIYSSPLSHLRKNIQPIYIFKIYFDHNLLSSSSLSLLGAELESVPRYIHLLGYSHEIL